MTYHPLYEDFLAHEHEQPKPTGSRYQRNKAMVDELLASLDVTKMRVPGDVFAAACKALVEEMEAENRQLDHLATEAWLDRDEEREPESDDDGLNRYSN
jgi:hypothetical protein